MDQLWYRWRVVDPVDNLGALDAEKMSSKRHAAKPLCRLVLRAVGVKLSTWHSRHDGRYVQ